MVQLSEFYLVTVNQFSITYTVGTNADLVPQVNTSSVYEHQELQSYSVDSDFDLFVVKSLTDACWLLKTISNQEKISAC